jgi:hypothetical protein
MPIATDDQLKPSPAILRELREFRQELSNLSGEIATFRATLENLLDELEADGWEDDSHDAEPGSTADLRTGYLFDLREFLSNIEETETLFDTAYNDFLPSRNLPNAD